MNIVTIVQYEYEYDSTRLVFEGEAPAEFLGLFDDNSERSMAAAQYYGFPWYTADRDESIEASLATLQPLPTGTPA